MKDMNKEKPPVTKKGMCDPRIGALCIPQVCLGSTFSFLSFYVGYFHGEFILPSTSSSERVDLSSKLAYALRCSFPMLITLIAGIMIIAAKRALTKAINPLSGNDGLILVDKLYLSNTLEQFVVGLTLMLIIATYTDSPQLLRLLPVFSAVFTIGRVLFRIGYGFHGMYRATGMSMNFGAMYVMIIIAAYHVSTKDLTDGLHFPWLPNTTFTSTKGEL